MRLFTSETTLDRRVTDEGRAKIRGGGASCRFSRSPVRGLLAILAILSLGLPAGQAGAAPQSPPQAGPPDVPEGPAPVVAAEQIEGGELALRESSDAPLSVPNHPPIDQIPPMPMSNEEYEERPAASGPGSGVLFDPETGEETLFPEAPGPIGAGGFAAGGGYGGADGGGGIADIERPATFSNMSVISTSNRANHPWRMNVKLVMRFGSSYFVCSGTMRDAETVLTAGHCVYDYGGAGWADEIWVYPGWDGVGSVVPNPPSISKPYGWARGTYFGSWTGWTSSGDFNYDVGLIGVTRAVGMLTGWFGWAYGGSCSFRTGQSWSNASYPAENCPVAGLHNGRDMYYWFGSFDSCPSSNRLQVNNSGGCFNAGWGGMSGSGAYYIDGSSRYVHAMASTSNRATWTRYARQFENWVDWSNGTFLPNVRGAAFDLQALDVNAGPSVIPAGGKTTLLNHLATNPTNGAKNATFKFRVYLSANDNISSSDTLLSTQQYVRNFAPMTSVRINMAQVTIPASTPPGTYYLGLEYDTTTDGNSSNNDTDGWDAVRITVTKPDLDITVLSAPSSAKPGTTISVTNSVKNLGNATAGSSSLGLYISSDSTCTTSDLLRTSRTISSLAPNATSTSNSSVFIPSNTTLGTKYICGIADRLNQVAETNEGNNTAFDSIQIVQPNLRLSALNAPSAASPGSTIAVANTVQNAGTTSAGAFRVGLYLSGDPICTTGDTFLGFRSLASLASGASSTVNSSVTIPAGTTAGTKYVCGIADYLSQVAESSESDNTRADAINILIPTVNLEINGADATYPAVLNTRNPVKLTLDMTPGLSSVDHYFATISGGVAYWAKPGGGFSNTPVPFTSFTPGALTDAVLLDATLPGGVWTFAWFMVDGGSVVDSDIIAANVAP